MSERLVGIGIAAASAMVFGFLGWLLYLHPASAAGAGAQSSLPAWNAAFNAASAVSLGVGYRAIRAGDRRRHAACMLGALAFSAAFLVGYVVHHYAAGDTRFAGPAWLRPVYFTVLISHVGVTVAALPMILTTVWRAGRGDYAGHKVVARRTLPLWLYVSVTGVLIFVFLRGWS